MNVDRHAPAALMALGALLLAGCGDETSSTSPAPATSLVGSISGSDVVVGMAANEGELTFYVCGGAATYGHASRWFIGAEDPSGAIDLQKDGWSITGDRATGEGRLVTPDGVEASWSARATAEDSLEGLYAVLDGTCRTGVVVTDASDAADPVIQGTWCDGAGKFAQVTPILPAQITAQGLEVQVQHLEVTKKLFVRRVGAK